MISNKTLGRLFESYHEIIGVERTKELPREMLKAAESFWFKKLIQEAITIDSKPWRYPKNYELPENKSKIMFYLNDPYTKDICVGIFRNNRFLDKACADCMWHKSEEVKCWMYTPEMPKEEQ